MQDNIPSGTVSGAAHRFAWVKGRFVPREQAVISIEERGFRFGDGAFETIRIHEGRLYQWQAHRKRLEEGLKTLRISFDTGSILEIARELVKLNEVKEGILRLSVSRGVGSRGYLPQVQGGATLVIETQNLPASPSAPVMLWRSELVKPSSAGLISAAKLMQGAFYTLARMEAADHSCFDAIVTNEQGQLCETSSANLFWIKENRLYTPALECGVVAGTMREAVLRLSHLQAEQGCYRPEVLKTAEECFLTNAAYGVVKVGMLKQEGLRWVSHKHTETLSQAIEKDIRTHAVR